MKITIFIYDNFKIISRRIDYDMLDDILLDDYQGKDTVYMVAKNANTNEELEKYYEEFKKRIHR